MNKMLKEIFLKSGVFFSLLFAGICAAEVVEDNHYYSLRAQNPVVVDGVVESAWNNAPWDGMNYVWLNDDAPDSTDYYGRYKMMWDSNFLYLLVEVTDDILSDQNADPLFNYYNDDCVEIFLDPNKDGGDHQNNYSAWAYHVSTLLDVADYGADGSAHLYNDHINVSISNVGDKYIWEMAIKVFDDSYDDAKINSPMTLVSNSIMGFSLAYCDNDELVQRENFMGSVNTEGHIDNAGYVNADVFGALSLVEALPTPNIISAKRLSQIELARDGFRLISDFENQVEVYDLKGVLVFSKVLKESELLANELNQGIYLIRLNKNIEMLKWNKTN